MFKKILWVSGIAALVITVLLSTAVWAKTLTIGCILLELSKIELKPSMNPRPYTRWNKIKAWWL